MKQSIIQGVSKKRVDALFNSPELVRLRELRERVRSGKATSEEIARYNEMLKPVRDINPMVLVD